MLNLTNSRVQLHIGRRIELLHAGILCKEPHTHLLRLHVLFDEVMQQVSFHLHELARYQLSHIEMLCTWLERLIMTKNLISAGRRHGSDKE